MYLKQIEIGPMKNYIYFIGDEKTKETVLVDPAWDVNKILKVSQEEDLNIKGIFITHAHRDHTNGIKGILKKLDIPVYISKYEAEFYDLITENIQKVDVNFETNIGDINIRFLHTPGHTPGSQCFLAENKLIAGDTLFLDGCGRCDLPGGNAEEMYKTIYNKLWRLPDDTIIYPGHNYHKLKKDNLGSQKKSNPYMNCMNLKEFIRLRMG